ncbi:ArsR/SmtB family transcription factor [Acidobacteriota bacterium]
MEKSNEYFELHAEVCKTFGHPKRLKVIFSLMEKELTVTELARETEIDTSNLSQHLHILRDKGIVATRREGTKIFYSLAHPNIKKAVDLMSDFLVQSIKSSEKILSGE